MNITEFAIAFDGAKTIHHLNSFKKSKMESPSLSMTLIQ